MPRTYEILELPFHGRIRVSNLIFHEVTLPPLPKDLEVTVEENWQKVLEKNPSAFSGPVMSIRAVNVWGTGEIHIDYTMTNYKYFSATSYPAIRDTCGANAVHTATAIRVVIVTADNNVLLHLRGRDMAYRRHFHVPGGMLSTPDPVAAIKKEIEEEIGIPFDQCPEPELLGIACDLNPGRMNHEFCFKVQLPVTTAGAISGVRRRHAQATAKDEGLIIPVLNAQETIEAFLEIGDEHAKEIWVPTGHAALVLHGRSMGWWRETQGWPKLIAQEEALLIAAGG